MEQTTPSIPPVAGISASINNRHAFVYERVLEYIVRETEQAGSVAFNKAQLAHGLGCCVRSLDRAVHRLRTEGLITSKPQFMASGAQGANVYSATRRGVAVANRWRDGAVEGAALEPARSSARSRLRRILCRRGGFRRCTGTLPVSCRYDSRHAREAALHELGCRRAHRARAS